VVQAPFGLSAGLILELDLRFGLALFSLGGEANLRQHKPIGPDVPDGTFTANPAAVWLGGGVAPRLGPGRFFAQVTVGLSLLWASAQSPTFFQERQGTAVDLYLGLCGGYLLELPAGFGLAVRYEERWVPAPTSFGVESTTSTVAIRTFSGDLALLASYAFF
jgi:hypothetical protein